MTFAFCYNEYDEVEDSFDEENKKFVKTRRIGVILFKFYIDIMFN